MNHELYMNRCLELAQKGQGNVAPNPMVGAVVVYQDKIIGEGYHKEFGREHAEVNAINAVHDKSLLTASTIYVNLEPCAHFGKTPPCSDLIIQYKIPHVVIGAIDDHEKVAGKGVQKLEKAGVKVEVNILKKECLSLNRRFYKFHNSKRPFVILKWAETKDGFVSRGLTSIKNGEDNWITNSVSKKAVHEQRAVEQAIIIGKTTALIDNPELTTRLVEGKSPLRVIVCHKPLLNENLKILKDDSPTLIFNTEIDQTVGLKEWIKFSGNLIEVLNELYKRNIQSVIVEGGTQLINQFLDQKIWDEAYNFIGDKEFLNGIKAPKINALPFSEKKIENDLLRIFKKL
tara:strand:- start:20337 stop:21368 length:1032 start_codon:yes stop_codon:yes gene_type:complete